MNSKENPLQQTDISMVRCVEGPLHANEKVCEMDIKLDDTTLIVDGDSKLQEVQRLLDVVDGVITTADSSTRKVSYAVFQEDKEIPELVSSTELPGVCAQMNDIHLGVTPVSYLLFDGMIQHPQELQSLVDIREACDAINSEHSGIYKHQLSHLNDVCPGKKPISTWFECNQRSEPWHPRSQ